MRGLGIKTLVLVALLALVAVAGYGVFGRSAHEEPPPATPEVATAPTLTPEPTATPTPTPTPMPPPAVSVDEAQALVRAYFAALENSDFERMRQLTDGQARETTDGVAGEVQRAEQANNVDLSASTKSLDCTGSEVRENGVALKTRFAIDIAAQAAFFRVPVRALEGEALFLVEFVDGQARITRVEGDFRLGEAS